MSRHGAGMRKGDFLQNFGRETSSDMSTWNLEENWRIILR
jgi:hypothetical protein